MKWNKYNSEKNQVNNLHDSLKKFKSQLSKNGETIDINQLKLDTNFDNHFLKNKNNANFSLKDRFEHRVSNLQSDIKSNQECANNVPLIYF